MREHKYQKWQFKNTDALREYRDKNNLTNKILAERCGECPKRMAQWISRKRVPSLVLKQFGLIVRGTSPDKIRGKGKVRLALQDTRICFVPAKSQGAFDAFCSALGIVTKKAV